MVHLLLSGADAMEASGPEAQEYGSARVGGRSRRTSRFNCAGLALACTGLPGAQRCDSCLDFTNSGPQGTAETQCTTDGQCCIDRNLRCVADECCTQRGYACTAGTCETECCSGDTCGDVTDYQGTRSNICCGGFGASCGLYSPCCDGFLCYDGTCHLAPGEACTENAQCANYSGCKIETPPTGVCCGHDMASCDSDADCCSGSCDETFGTCNWAQEYGQCLDDSDCSSRVFGQWNGTVCGGNPIVGPFRCFPVPGDTCLSEADCCEVGDSCKVPYDGSNASALCCRETPSSFSDDAQCCTGTCWSHYVAGSPVGTCCAYPWLKTFTCASNADCCDSPTYSGVCARTVRGRERCHAVLPEDGRERRRRPVHVLQPKRPRRPVRELPVTTVRRVRASAACGATRASG